MGDTFNQNHSGSGNNVINIGRQKFSLNDQILREIYDAVRTIGEVIIEPHGVQSSFPMADEIVAYLKSVGVNAVRGGGVMMMMPPPEGPLELRGSTLLVDASK